MKVDVLLGLQWGDEGKGKVVDVLTPRYDVVARFQGGPNAGHTLEFEGQKYVLRSLCTFAKHTLAGLQQIVHFMFAVYQIELLEVFDAFHPSLFHFRKIIHLSSKDRNMCSVPFLPVSFREIK